MSFTRVTLRSLQAPKKWALNGGPFGSKLIQRDYVESGVPVIRGCNLSTDCKFNADEFVFVTQEKSDELLPSNAHAGDLVFTQRGTLGQVGIIPDTLPFPRYVISQSQMKLTVDRHKADPTYIYYVFKAPETVQRIHNQAFSSGVPHINLEILRDFEIELPELPVQQRISAILSAYDDLIENNTRRIKILEDMAQMLYREWFVNFRFPGHEKVLMVESELGPIPQGWRVELLETLVEEFIDYRGKTPKKLGGDWSESGILALSALNVKQGRLVRLDKAKFVSEELYRRWMKSELRGGDILMTSEAPLGEVYFLPETRRYCLSQRVFSIRSRTVMMQPSLLFFTLSSPEGQKQLKSRASGTTVLGIRQADLRRIPVVRPPVPLQRHGDSMLRPFLTMIDVLQRKSDVLRRTRDFLLPKLISAEIPVKAAAELMEQNA